MRPLVFLLSSCLAFVPGLHADDNLKELGSVKIVVEDLNPGGREVGLTTDWLESVLLVALKRDLPRLRIGKDFLSFVYLNVHVMKEHTVGGRLQGCAAAVDLKVYRPAHILSDDLGSRVLFAVVTVWQKGDLLSGSCDSIGQQVKESVDKLVTRLAADYYRAN